MVKLKQQSMSSTADDFIKLRIRVYLYYYYFNYMHCGFPSLHNNFAVSELDRSDQSSSQFTALTADSAGEPDRCSVPESQQRWAVLNHIWMKNIWTLWIHERLCADPGAEDRQTDGLTDRAPVCFSGWLHPQMMARCWTVWTGLLVLLTAGECCLVSGRFSLFLGSVCGGLGGMKFSDHISK